MIAIDPDRKRCPRCKEVLPFEVFSKDRSRKDGLSTYCKKCQKYFGRKQRENERASRAVTPPQFPNTTPEGRQPREIIAEIRERITTLRTLGYSFEGKLTYLQTIKL